MSPAISRFIIPRGGTISFLLEGGTGSGPRLQVFHCLSLD
jgi:hypothetical protein